MHLSTLLPCIVALASTAVNAQAQNVLLYTKPSYEGESWAFTGDPYTCTNVNDLVYGKVFSAALALTNAPPGFYCRLYSFDNCLPSSKVNDIAVLSPQIPNVSNPDIRSIQCHIWPKRA
ncbi:hypothetical protein V8C42DRAFT_310925 [Trichoderma barbatum]